MNVTLDRPLFRERVTAPPSKSESHRAMICAALGKREVFIPCPITNNDIEATARCLTALGADISLANGGYTVRPITEPNSHASCDCGESGTTLRFIIPICAALGCEAEIRMHGRLPQRPLSPLDSMLAERGVAVNISGDVLTVKGKLPANEAWRIAGNVSSQFISGMLFALAIVGGTLTVTGNTESKPYINMTEKTMALCGARLTSNGSVYTVEPSVPLDTPSTINVGGDWSGAAFPLCIGVVGGRPVTVDGLDINSAHGDREIVNVLRRMGADIRVDGSSVTAYPSALAGITVDCGDIPDLVPVLAVVAMKAAGKTEFINAGRLRLKESDRLTAIANLINDIGGSACECGDMLTVFNKLPSGGDADSANDHRIAMSAAVAAFLASGEIRINNAQCVSKSYPTFWEEFEAMK